MYRAPADPFLIALIRPRWDSDKVTDKGFNHLGLPHPLLSSPTTDLSISSETKGADLVCQPIKILRV